MDRRGEHCTYCDRGWIDTPERSRPCPLCNPQGLIDRPDGTDDAFKRKESNP